MPILVFIYIQLEMWQFTAFSRQSMLSGKGRGENCEGLSSCTKTDWIVGCSKFLIKWHNYWNKTKFTKNKPFNMTDVLIPSSSNFASGVTDGRESVVWSILAEKNKLPQGAEHQMAERTSQFWLVLLVALCSTSGWANAKGKGEKADAHDKHV